MERRPVILLLLPALLVVRSAAADPPPDVSDVDAAFAATESAPPPAPGATPTGGAPAATASLNPDLSLVLDLAGAYYSDRPNNAGAHDPPDTGPHLQALELAAGAAVDPYFRLDANLAFNDEEAELEEAYGTTLDLPGGLQARAGKFLTRFGRENRTHPHTWDFVEQPFALSRVFGGEGSRGVGLELSWLTPLPWSLEVVGSATPATGAETARSFAADTGRSIEHLDDLLYVGALKQFFPLTDDWSLAWGLSGAFGPGPVSGSRSEVYGTDVYVKFRPITRESVTLVSLTAEWLLRRRRADASLTDVDGFTELFYRFAKRWGVGARHEFGTASLGEAGVAVPDPLDPTWIAPRQRVSAAVTFWPTEFSRLRLEGSRDDGGDQHPVWGAVLALELVAGAHGAHAF